MESEEGRSAQFYDHLRSQTNDDDLRNYCYAGGSRPGRHYNYWITQGHPDDAMPPYVTECACGHPIEENCFIRHKPTNKFIVLGNCCIKRYIPASGRTCERCEKPHQNRKDNLCNSCRMRRKCCTCNKEYVLDKWELSELDDDSYECKDCTERIKRQAERGTRVYINVQYKDKESAKAAGARWEPLCQSWYVNGALSRDFVLFPKHSETIQVHLRTLVETKHDRTHMANRITHA